MSSLCAHNGFLRWLSWLVSKNRVGLIYMLGICTHGSVNCDDPGLMGLFSVNESVKMPR